MALQGLWTLDLFEDFQMIFSTDVSQPFIDYEESLSLWSTDIAIALGKKLDETTEKQT